GAVAAASAEGESDEAVYGRACDRGGLKEHLVESDRGRELVALYEAWRERAARGPYKRGEGGADGGQSVEVQHVREAELRADREPGRADRQADLGDDEQPTPIDSIGDDATDERERDQRDRLKKTDQAHVQRRPCKEIDLVGDGHQAQLRPGEGYELAEPQQWERARFAKR